jgi:hypothetical protein
VPNFEIIFFNVKNCQILYLVPVGSQKIEAFFLLSIFNYKIWLNFLMDDCHFSNITQMEIKKEGGGGK